MRAAVIGAGLAGCEAAIYLAKNGVEVTLYEQKPHRYSPAHKNENFAELVCSNSLKAKRLNSAAGLLKAEMQVMGSAVLAAASECEVGAGGALAVERDDFAAAVTRMVKSTPGITIKYGEVTEIPKDGFVLVASGPLTQGALADSISEYTGQSALSFYDAAAPIVEGHSIDMDKVFAASRYTEGEGDYINCPMDKEQYEAFYEALIGAERAPLEEFDTPLTVYEGCMPVEVMASRGKETLRFGPLRPVGLRNPATGHRPWANLQLRKENEQGTLYNLVGFQTNLKFGEQKRVFGMIPGLENAQYARYGVMHRNTFLDSPKLLNPTLNLKSEPRIFFGGQITGCEGYTESAATGILAAHFMLCAMRGGEAGIPPETTMCGALLRHISTPNKNFQPMGANIGILPPLEEHERDKAKRYMLLAQRGLDAFSEYWQKF